MSKSGLSWLILLTLAACTGKNASTPLIQINTGWIRTWPIEDVTELSDIPDLIHKRWKVEDPLPLEGGNEGALQNGHSEGKQRLVKSCAEYERAQKAGCHPTQPSAQTHSYRWDVRCQALRVLAAAKPAKQSFLQGYRFSVQSLADLPPCVGISIGGDSTQWGPLEKAMHDGRSWKNVHQTYEIHKLTPTSLSVLDKTGGLLTWDLLAWGDFNGDDYEDLLLMASTGETTSPYRALYQLTRKKPNEIFRVIQATGKRAENGTWHGCVSTLNDPR